LDLDHPPFEEHLSRQTLWPEAEKLYGHGYEISALAASHDGSIVATACKATSIDHAVIRLFETKNWHEIKPPLTAHSLTIARLRFSSDDQYLLSVGRDRQWAVFQRDIAQETIYKLLESNPKGHSRMILDAAWAATSLPIFATAGRDKQVKIWAKDQNSSFTQRASITEDSPVTSIDFPSTMLRDNQTLLAVGTELGIFKLYSLDLKEEFAVAALQLYSSNSFPNPSKPITQLAWRPSQDVEQENSDIELEIAIASEDNSLRIYSLNPYVT